MFIFANMQFFICILALNVAEPFRKPIYTNPIFLITLIASFGYCGYLIYAEDDWNIETFTIQRLPNSFRHKLLIITIINSIISFFYERFLIAKF